MAETAADLVFSCRAVAVDYPHPAGRKEVLRNISFDVRRGEIVTIVGPSGTGKTTLLRVLGGLTPYSTGRVLIEGHEIQGPPENAIIVFQDYSHALLQWRTVARNVALGIERRLPTKDVALRVAKALRMVRLEKNADDYPWQLSGGMQQRVQIARALALEPAVLLMDEPFAALDAMTKAAMQDELLRVRDETGASFVFITHDIEEAVYLGDRVAILNGSPGRIERTFDIDLPRPRDQIVTRQTGAFLHYRYEIHQALGAVEHG